jgi:prepilin-type processing-associated H-X9-DG protein
MTASQNSQRGLSLIEVCLVIATVALLAFVFLPTLVRPHARSSKVGCVNCLKQIGLSYRLFANDHDDKYPFAVPTTADGTLEFVKSPQVFRHFQALSNELNTPKILVCPEDTKRQRATDFTLAGPSSFNRNANLSYFVGFDADESKPERLLSGDRNITGGTFSNGFLRLLKPATPAGWTSEIHQNAGNIGLADGSVMQTDALALRRQLRTNTLATIRLAIP